MADGHEKDVGKNPSNLGSSTQIFLDGRMFPRKFKNSLRSSSELFAESCVFIEDNDNVVRKQRDMPLCDARARSDVRKNPLNLGSRTRIILDRRMLLQKYATSHL